MPVVNQGKKPGVEVDKLIGQLERIWFLQRIILGYLALLFAVMIITWVSPSKEEMSQILLPLFHGILLTLFYGILLVIPFALVVMVMTLQTLNSMARFDAILKPRANIAGWLSVFMGAYILGSFVFADSINAWAMSQSHDLVVAAQSSPVVMGLILLGTHVYVVKSSQSHLTKLSAS
jgi:hypothetical protein